MGCCAAKVDVFHSNLTKQRILEDSLKQLSNLLKHRICLRNKEMKWKYYVWEIAVACIVEQHKCWFPLSVVDLLVLFYNRCHCYFLHIIFSFPYFLHIFRVLVNYWIVSSSLCFVFALFDFPHDKCLYFIS